MGVITKLLEIFKDPNFEIRSHFFRFKDLGYWMSLKVHFMNSYLDYFYQSISAVSEELGEINYRDIIDIDSNYPR